MTDSPFSDTFDEGKFYTQSSDRHHHSERANYRVPGEWLHFASVVANSPACPEYETVSDLMRDGFAKAIGVALARVNDPEHTARWSVQLGILELERAEANDRADMDAVDLWGKRLSAGHGYDPDHFHRDREAMKNPEAIVGMERLQTRYNL